MKSKDRAEYDLSRIIGAIWGHLMSHSHTVRSGAETDPKKLPLSEYLGVTAALHF